MGPVAETVGEALGGAALSAVKSSMLHVTFPVDLRRVDTRLYGEQNSFKEFRRVLLSSEQCNQQKSHKMSVFASKQISDRRWQRALRVLGP